jgi:RNA polymerase sigma factor (sigma-70 family)
MRRRGSRQIRGERPLRLADRATADPTLATRMSDDTVTELLERLSSGRVGAAWSEFLALYSPLIMHVIRRQDADDDRAAECFIDVCAALADDGFRRLRSFQPDGPARFRTWLVAVVSNLCVDWRRKQHGRARPLRRVARLAELDQQVYHCIFVRGLSRAECVAALVPRFPELTEASVSEINARLFALLTPQQRWQLSVRTPMLRPVTCTGPEDEDPTWQVATPGPGPDELTAESQEQRRLQDALAKLPAEQRLLLRLRYEQNLTLAEVARLTGQPDPFRANRQIQAALDTLAGLMGGQRSQPERKSH